MTTSLDRALVFVVLVLVTSLAAAAHAVQDPRLQGVETLIERGDAEGALEMLRQLKGKPSAEALLLRSTARIMTGATQEGFKDLERALKMDPGLRQGWLNLAGLEIAEQRYDAAYEALAKVQELDPGDPDNQLNLGAVQLFRREFDPAAAHFERYIEAKAGQAEAPYLVASNYALAGLEAQAVEYLSRAVVLDERMRLRSRSDERFLGLQSAAYRKLLETDTFTPPAESFSAAKAFKEPYRMANVKVLEFGLAKPSTTTAAEERTVTMQGNPDWVQDPKLLYVVLDALKSEGIGYNPAVETNAAWALVWSDPVRIKLFNQKNGTGVVKLTAPAGAYRAEEWQRLTSALFKSIYAKLQAAETSSLR